MSDVPADADMPEGWAGTTVGEVSTQIQYGYTASASSEVDGPKFLRITDIQDGLVDWKTVPSCKITSDDIAKFALATGDIVFARTGATTGKSYLIRSCPAAVFASYLIRLRPRPPLDPRFLSLFFQTPDYWQLISENVSGNAQPNCNASKLAALPMPLPPLAEQKRIVAKVEKLLARVNAARQRLAKVPALLKRFRQSVLAAACSGKLTEGWRAKSRTPLEHDELPTSWTEQRLADVSLRVTDGTHLPPALAPDGVPFILIGNIVNKRIEWDLIRKWVTRETYEKLTARCKPEMGDVLYTAVGATFGQALAVETDRPFIFQRHIAHIKPNYAKVATGFLVGALNSPAIFAHAQDVAKGAAQPTVTLTDLKEFVIPIPPLAEQHEIVRRVEALLARADRIEKLLATATRRVETLTQTILAQAFRGELVPTEAELARQEGRDYEPASALLDRIRSENVLNRQPASPSPTRRAKAVKQKADEP